MPLYPFSVQNTYSCIPTDSPGFKPGPSQTFGGNLFLCSHKYYSRNFHLYKYFSLFIQITNKMHTLPTRYPVIIPPVKHGLLNIPVMHLTLYRSLPN